jgi:hypothetical protein
MFFDSGLIAAALPPGLRLRQVTGVPRGKHPIILSFGQQKNVTTTVLDPSVRLDYAEAVIGLPNVGLSADSSDHVGVYMPRLDVSDPIATILGWTLGYQKVLSAINASVRLFTVQTLLTRIVVYDWAVELTGLNGRPVDFPNFCFTADLLRQPIISVDAGGLPIFTVFDWKFDESTLFGSEALLEVSSECLSVLPRGRYSWNSYKTDIAGAGRFAVPWELTGPFYDWPTSASIPDSGGGR